MTPDLSAVGQLAREGDPDRFHASLFAHPDVREGMFAIIALNAELAKIAVTVSEPLLGEIRLQWWVEALDDLFQNGNRRPHEILEALPANLSPDIARALIDARRFDIHDVPMADRAALDAYLSATGGGVARLMAEAGGATGEALEIAGGFGWSEATGRLIEALPRLYHEGISAIPVEGTLDRNALAEGKMPENLREALRPLAADALHRLSALRRRRALLPAPARPACLSAHIYEGTLRNAAGEGFSIFTSPDRPSPFRARLSLLWRGMTGRV
ncbi:MAG: phytoene/squalene synthase family protein [Pikeienuella sp.]